MSSHVDPTVPTDESAYIERAAAALAVLDLDSDLDPMPSPMPSPTPSPSPSRVRTQDDGMLAGLDFGLELESASAMSGVGDDTAGNDGTHGVDGAAGADDTPHADASADLPARRALAAWIAAEPDRVPVLGLSVGLSRERLKNALRHAFDTPSWGRLARERADDLVRHLDVEFGLVASLRAQRDRTYTFGDVLVARAGTRVSAVRAGTSGRRLEDEIETIARDLGLPSQTRTRFGGRNGLTAPCDLVIPSAAQPDIVVAAKGFDSTGSKLTDAVREIEEMAQVRLPRQFVIAVIDGIGWKSRQSDLRRIHALWESHQIDGMYTVATLPRFRTDLAEAARLRGLL
ncbi:hypothetical protein ACPEEZ_12280 [Frigoribacterium sp. 2-23]|uniref:hypothetical protein n=1 Tax=Frigoribacterium sp. 2-23 TaxID=3415006 RepID=UPI003C70455C